MVEYSGLVAVALCIFALSCEVFYGAFLLYRAACAREQEARRLHESTARHLEKFVALEEKWTGDIEESLLEELKDSTGQPN